MKFLRGLVGLLVAASAGSTVFTSVSCGGGSAATGAAGMGGSQSGSGGSTAGTGGSIGGFGGSDPILPSVIDESRIPTGHPRLFFNAERLAQAKQWFAVHP